MTQFGVLPRSSGPLARKLLAQAVERRIAEETEARIRERMAAEAIKESATTHVIKEAREAERRARCERIFNLVRRSLSGKPKSLLPSQFTKGRRIILATALRHGITYMAVISAGKGKVLTPIRHEAMYLIARDTLLSLPSIGRLLRRDHTTVINGIRRHCERNGLPVPREPRRA